MREQTRILHDVADGAPERDGIAIAHVLAVEQDAALGGIDHAIDHAQQRGLAASGGAEQDRDRARGHVGREGLHSRRGVTAPTGERGIALGHSVELNGAGCMGHAGGLVRTHA